MEGAELEVLESIFEIGSDPIITCEILPVYSVENKERLVRQNAIHALLTKHKYNIYRIHKNIPVQLEKISEFDIHSDLAKSDYVFIPNGQEEIIIRKFN